MLDLSWDHNAYYHRLLSRQLPPYFGRALDVGCGAGTFAAHLARRADHVDAVDADATMTQLALTRVPANVTVIHADIAHAALHPDGYDVITSISTLHHVPLADTLTVLASRLRAGGTLAAIAVPKIDLPRDLPVEAAAVLAHRVLGVTFAVRMLLDGQRPYPFERSHADMPTADPSATTTEVRELAERVLPGVRVRRLLFWRYLLVWRRGPECFGPASG